MENIKKIPSSNKGEIAVLKVELAANLKGYNVCMPKNQASRYDLILDTGKKLSRAQVKYLSRKSRNKDCLELQLANKSQNRKSYTDKDIDIILVYISKLDVILYIQPKDFHNRTTISFNLKNEKAPNFYKKYLW